MDFSGDTNEYKEIHLEEEEKIIKICKALGSKTRYKILQILIDKELDISNLAENIKQTEANVSAQVKYLQDVGLVSCRYESGIHGIRKICRTRVKTVAIKIISDKDKKLKK